MMFSDVDLMVALGERRLKVEPFATSQVQPASIDLHLDDEFLLARRGVEPVDVRGPAEFTRGRWNPFTMETHQFALASTVERVSIAPGLCGFVAGKSSLARHGLIVEAAGLVDPGFEGNLTLELFNMAPRPLLLTPGTRIAQLYVFELKNPAARPYGSGGLGSRYQGQEGPTAPREGL